MALMSLVPLVPSTPMMATMAVPCPAVVMGAGAICVPVRLADPEKLEKETPPENRVTIDGTVKGKAAESVVSCG
jgi:hypothetical protein